MNPFATDSNASDALIQGQQASLRFGIPPPGGSPMPKLGVPEVPPQVLNSRARLAAAMVPPPARPAPGGVPYNPATQQVAPTGGQPFHIDNVAASSQALNSGALDRPVDPNSLPAGYQLFTPQQIKGYIANRAASAPGTSLRDLWVDLKHGVQQMPGMAAGIADIPLSLLGMNRPVSRAAEAAGDFTGFTPGKWAEDPSQYTAGRQVQDMQSDAAWKEGTGAGIADLATNPGRVLGHIVQALPSVVAGGVVGRAAALAGKFSGAVGAGVGEGAVTAGQTMSQIDKNVDPRIAAGASLGAGITTGVLGGVGARVAGKMGLPDIDALGANVAAGAASRMPFWKRAPVAAVQEGVFEEFPQSYTEQMWQNAAEGKPLDENAMRAGITGLAAGAGMGAMFQMYKPRAPLDPNAPTSMLERQPDAPETPPPPAGLTMPKSNLTNTIGKAAGEFDKALQGNQDAALAELQPDVTKLFANAKKPPPGAPPAAAPTQPPGPPPPPAGGAPAAAAPPISIVAGKAVVTPQWFDETPEAAPAPATTPFNPPVGPAYPSDERRAAMTSGQSVAPAAPAAPVGHVDQAAPSTPPSQTTVAAPATPAKPLSATAQKKLTQQQQLQADATTAFGSEDAIPAEVKAQIKGLQVRKAQTAIRAAQKVRDEARDAEELKKALAQMRAPRPRGDAPDTRMDAIKAIFRRKLAALSQRDRDIIGEATGFDMTEDPWRQVGAPKTFAAIGALYKNTGGKNTGKAMGEDAVRTVVRNMGLNPDNINDFLEAHALYGGGSGFTPVNVSVPGQEPSETGPVDTSVPEGTPSDEAGPVMAEEQRFATADEAVAADEATPDDTVSDDVEAEAGDKEDETAKDEGSLVAMGLREIPVDPRSGKANPNDASGMRLSGTIGKKTKKDTIEANKFFREQNVPVKGSAAAHKVATKLTAATEEEIAAKELAVREAHAAARATRKAGIEAKNAAEKEANRKAAEANAELAAEKEKTERARAADKAEGEIGNNRKMELLQTRQMVRQISEAWDVKANELIQEGVEGILTWRQLSEDQQEQMLSIFAAGPDAQKHIENFGVTVEDISAGAFRLVKGSRASNEERAEVQAALDGKSAREAVEWLTQNGPSANRTVAKAVLRQMDKLVTKGVAFTFKVNKIGDMVKYRGNGATQVNADSSVVAVFLNATDTSHPGVDYETALHEFIHAVTTTALTMGSYEATRDTPMGGAYIALNKVRNAAITAFNERVKLMKAGKRELTAFERAMYQNANNAFKDGEETLAWGLSSAEAQEFLESIPVEKSGKTLWDWFVQGVRVLLGLTPNADTALSELLKVGKIALNLDVNDIEAGANKFKSSLAARSNYNRMQKSDLADGVTMAGRGWLDDSKYFYHAVRDDATIASIMRDGLHVGSNVGTTKGQPFEDEGGTVLVFERAAYKLKGKGYQGDEVVVGGTAKPVAVLKDVEPHVHQGVPDADYDAVSDRYEALQKSLHGIALALELTDDELSTKMVRAEIRAEGRDRRFGYKESFVDMFGDDFGDRLAELNREQNQLFKEMDRVDARASRAAKTADDVLEPYLKFGLPVHRLLLDYNEDTDTQTVDIRDARSLSPREHTAAAEKRWKDEKINPKVRNLVDALNDNGTFTTLSGDLYSDELVYVDIGMPLAAGRKIKLPPGWKATSVLWMQTKGAHKVGEAAKWDKENYDYIMSDAYRRNAAREHPEFGQTFTEETRLSRAGAEPVSKEEAAKVAQAVLMAPSWGPAVSDDAPAPTPKKQTLNDVPPALLKKVKVTVEQLHGGEVKQVEVSAQAALKDLDEEIAAYEKLLACVRGA